MPGSVEPFGRRIGSRKNQVIPCPGQTYVQQTVFFLGSLCDFLCLHFTLRQTFGQGGTFELFVIRIYPVPQPAIAEDVVEVNLGIFFWYDTQSPQFSPDVFFQVVTHHNRPFQPFAAVIGHYIDSVRTFSGCLKISSFRFQFIEPQQ